MSAFALRLSIVGSNGLRAPSFQRTCIRTFQSTSPRVDRHTPLQRRRPACVGHARRGYASLTPNGSNNVQRVESDDATTFKEPQKVTISLNGRECHISPLLLRDACPCEKCVDPSTKQKRFSTTDIPVDITARRITRHVTDEGDSILLEWNDDIPGFPYDHQTMLSATALQKQLKLWPGRSQFQNPKRELWEADDLARSGVDMSFESYMQSDNGLHSALTKLHTHGLLFLTGVPESVESVAQIAERIGPLKSSFYGLTWEVRSVPQAKNVAYTSQDLGFHMDLMYMQEPPRLQLLHCMRSSASGGASRFVDSFRVAEQLRSQNLDAYVDLARHDVTFHYDHPDANLYLQTRKTIDLGLRPGLDRSKHMKHASHSRIHSVSWSPPFQAPFQAPAARPQSDLTSSQPSHAVKLREYNDTLTRWHAAARAFDALVHQPASIYERYMKPGECVIFDNRRVLHARTAFDVGDAGKERWLRGAYIDSDAFESKTQVIARRQANRALGQEVSEAETAATSL